MSNPIDKLPDAGGIPERQERDKIARMNHRIDEAAKQWARERDELEGRVEEFRDRLATALGKLLADRILIAKHVRRIDELTTLLEWLLRRPTLGFEASERIREALTPPPQSPPQ